MSEIVERVLREVNSADKRIRSVIRETPLEESLFLSQTTRCRVFHKLENYQITQSFKLRGAANKILTLTDNEKKRGIVTSSTGNHGAAVAHVLKILGVPGTLFLPETASSAKIEMLRLMGIDLEFFGKDCIEAEMRAREVAEPNGRVYVSPYNDLLVIAGQGTVGLEIVRQSKALGIGEPDAVFCPVGGGGLISGVGAIIKDHFKYTEIVGCQPLNSAVMYESIKAGNIVEIDSKPTLSDGTAGGIEFGSITFPLCRKNVDRFILVTEEEIRNAVLLMLEKHSMLVEGAAAISLAAFLQVKSEYQGRKVILIISGARLGVDTLKTLLR